MQTFTYSKNLKLLIIPIIFAVILLAFEIINASPSVESDHPSNALVLLFVMLFLSPLIGVVGLIHIKIKAKEKSTLKTISIILNLCIIIYGIVIWL